MMHWTFTKYTCVLFTSSSQDDPWSAWSKCVHENERWVRQEQVQYRWLMNLITFWHSRFQDDHCITRRPGVGKITHPLYLSNTQTFAHIHTHAHPHSLHTHNVCTHTMSLSAPPPPIYIYIHIYMYRFKYEYDFSEGVTREIDVIIWGLVDMLKSYMRSLLFVRNAGQDPARWSSTWTITVGSVCVFLFSLPRPLGS